jgi:two-component system sensor histidine kinase/response regulator
LINRQVVPFWEKLIGKKSNVSLEGRIFHSVCIIVLAGIGLNIPFNYFIGIPELAILMTVVFAGVLVIYYLSRFKGKVKGSITVFQIFNYLMLVANFYYNSGIQGPSYIIFLLSLLVTVAIIPRKQYWLWLPMNVGAILSLLFIEYTYPHWIANTYLSRDARFLDFGYTYIIVSSLVLFVTIYIRNAYHNERRLAEQKARDLAASNDTKNKLLSILAHDLKEPLSSIQGFLELLAVYKLDETERHDLEKELLVRTQQTSQMLVNVLSWTKSQMEGVNVKLSSLPLAETLGNTLQVLGGIAAGKGIELQNELTNNICVTGDKDMLQLVVRNLINNAIKFTNPGGLIKVNTQLANNICIISVADNGIGMPAAQQNAIFSLATNPTYGTSQEKGAGLGLVLCREFMELQGGEIWFTSEENKGSTFYMSMPLCTVKDAKSVNMIYHQDHF